MYGKLVALQRETRRRWPRGALREGDSDLASSMTSNVYSASGILWSPVRHLERESCIPAVPNASFMQDAGYGLRRMHLIRSRVH